MFESTVIPLLKARLAALEELHATLKVAQQEGTYEYRGGFEPLISRLKEQLRTSAAKHTICVIGEFKVGKSTFINSLLGLSGDAALSAEDSSDTASSILIRQRGPDDPESMLIFDERSAIPPRPSSWKEAKQLSSQFYRNSHPEAAREAESLIRVEYFIDHPLLAGFQLNDLPGTGTSYWKVHTRIAEQSMRTADTIVWLVFDDEPGSDGTQFMNIVLRESRRVLPVVNVRQEPPEAPDTAIAEEIADAITRRYRQHFDGVEYPFLYSARAMELEAAKAAPDPAVLQAGGYEALTKRLFFSDVSEHGAARREDRVCGSCRGLFEEVTTRIGEQSDAITTIRDKAAQSCTTFAERTRNLDEIHRDIAAQLVSIAEGYAHSVCEAVTQSAESFIEEKLKITNWETVKAVFNEKSTDVTRKWGEEFQRDYLSNDPHLQRLEKSAKEKARMTLLTLWSTQEEAIDQSLETHITAPRDLTVIQYEDFDKGLGLGILHVLGGVILIGLIFNFPLFLLVSGGFANKITSNPMERIRQEALHRTRRTVRNAGFSLQEEFISTWEEKSRQIQSQLRTRLGSGQDKAQIKLAKLQGIRQRLEDEARIFQEAANWLYRMQTEETAHG